MRITTCLNQRPLAHASFRLALLLAVTLGAVSVSQAAGPVTYHEHVAPLLFDRCASCHRPGQSGPFPLLSFRDAKEHAATMATVVSSGYMPPWKPVAKGIEFAGDRHLTKEQRAIIEQWVAAGCPEGDPAKGPSMPNFPSDWALGKPDLIVKMSEPFSIPASGSDLYRSFVFPVNLPEDRWIKAIELRPTARGAVHHALFFADDANARRRPERDGQPGFRGMNFLGGNPQDVLSKAPDRVTGGLGGYVPGATPNRLPGDLARLLPRGCNIVMQTHFHPTGKPETEQSELALYFADQPPSHRLQPIQMPPMFGAGAGINVPAGERNYRISDRYTLPIDVLAHEVGGHAHYICREMEMTARLPDGKELTLLEIDDWDLDWQDQYAFATPIALPKGTVLTTEIVYDNSADNPENPFSPPQAIAWGRESTDEMGSVTLTVTAADEAQRATLSDEMRERMRSALRARVRNQSGLLGGLGVGGNRTGSGLLGGLGSALGGRGQGSRLSNATGPAIANGLIRLLDRNRDGKLQEDELPEKNRDRMLEFIDQNRDGEIDAAEIEEARKMLQRFADEPGDSQEGKK